MKKTPLILPTISYGTINTQRHMGDQEEDHLLRRSSLEYEIDDGIDGSELGGANPDEVQEGVRKIEAINKTWTQRSLIIAYIG
jgi:hypothetical protein